MSVLDDILILAGCGLITYGAWLVMPLLVPFVAGAFCIALGIAVALSKRGDVE